MSRYQKKIVDCTFATSPTVASDCTYECDHMVVNVCFSLSLRSKEFSAKLKFLFGRKNVFDRKKKFSRNFFGAESFFCSREMRSEKCEEDSEKKILMCDQAAKKIFFFL